MNLIKWDPSVELEDITARLNRIFGRTPSRTDPTSDMLTVADWMPSVDISETDTECTITGELPGVSKSDVSITVQNGMLTIQGERRHEAEQKGKKYHRVECCYGSFMRSFRVPDDADEGKVKAEFKDGMLNISMPKSERTKAKTINVSVS